MASTLMHWLTYARAPINALCFAGRRALAWERGAPALANEPKGDLYAYLDGAERIAAERREAELRARYDLEPLRACSTQYAYRENVHLLDALERLFAGVDVGARGLRALDVGAQAWLYVFGLERFLGARSPQPVELTGVEIDGHGIYPDGRSRADHARAHAAATKNPSVGYRVADFLDEIAVPECGLDVVTMLYPFVSRYALLRWGLPLRVFRPERMMARAVAVLRPGGILVVFNQTFAERDAALAMARRAGASVQRSVPLAGRLVDYHARTAERVATLLRAPA